MLKEFCRDCFLRLECGIMICGWVRVLKILNWGRFKIGDVLVVVR